MNSTRKVKAKPLGPRAAFSSDEVAQIEALLTREERFRDRALFRLGIDTMLRSSDLLALALHDVWHLDHGIYRDFYIEQQKTGERVKVALSDRAVEALMAYITTLSDDPGKLCYVDRLFPISDRHHRRLVKEWAALIRLDPTRYSTHSVRRTKAKAIYGKTKNLAAVRVLLGHKSLGATATYLGVEQDDALNVAREVDI